MILYKINIIYDIICFHCGFWRNFHGRDHLNW